MITIKDQDFEMEQIKSTPFFNLKLPTKVNEGKENERSEMKLVGYGMPFETCIQQIVSKRFSLEDKTYSVKEYIESYIVQVEKLNTLVTYTYKPSKKDKKDDSLEELDEEQEEPETEIEDED